MFSKIIKACGTDKELLLRIINAVLKDAVYNSKETKEVLETLRNKIIDGRLIKDPSVDNFLNPYGKKKYKKNFQQNKKDIVFKQTKALDADLTKMDDDELLLKFVQNKHEKPPGQYVIDDRDFRRYYN